MTALSVGDTLNVFVFHKTAETVMKRAFTDSRVNKETLLVTEAACNFTALDTLTGQGL